MGFSYGSYVAYGVHVPYEQFTGRHVWAESDRVQEVLNDNRDVLPDVRYLTAGQYDDDFLFLTINTDGDEDSEVELGQFRRLNPTVDPMKMDDWNAQLKRAIQALDYNPSAFDEPSWLVVPDMS